MQRWYQVDPKAEYLYSRSPYEAMMNNPITYNDPQGDIAPLVIAGIALAGGIINTASNWGSINSFTEGLNYFATGAVGYGVATVNPVAGGLILAGGNLGTKAVNGDLPQLNSFGDVASVVTSVGLDFLGAYTLGQSTSWSSFQLSGNLTSAEVAQLAKEGIKPSITQVAGTGAKKTIAEQVIKSTTSQVSNQVVKQAVGNATKSIADDIISNGISYNSRVIAQKNLYHNFPKSFDKHIIQNGSWSQRIKDGTNWFELPGSINGTKGVYQIGVNNSSSIFHKNFVDWSTYLKLGIR